MTKKTTQITPSLSEKMKLKKQQKEIAKKQKMLVAGTGRLYNSGKFILNNLKKTLEDFKDQARTAGIYDKVEPIIKEIEESFGQYYTDLKDMENLVKTMNGSRKARSSKSDLLKATNTRFEKVSSELSTKLQELKSHLDPVTKEQVLSGEDFGPEGHFQMMEVTKINDSSTNVEDVVDMGIDDATIEVNVPEESVIMGVDAADGKDQGVVNTYKVGEDGVIDIFAGPDIISNPEVVGPLDIFEKE